MPFIAVSVDSTCRRIGPWIARDSSTTPGGNGDEAVGAPVPRCTAHLCPCRLFGMEYRVYVTGIVVQELLEKVLLLSKHYP